MLQRYLLLWLILLSGLAYGSTAVLPDDVNPFLFTASWLNWVFSIAMLAIGSLLPRDEVRNVIRRWPTVLGGTAIQYSAMPLLAFGLGWALGLEGPWLVGLVLVGCVPGAMASNVLTLLSRGNVSYSVSLTTSATLLSPLVVPFALWLTLRHAVDFPVKKTIVVLCWTVVLPVLSGHLLACRFDAWRRAAARVGSTIANLAILWIIAVVVAGSADKVAQVPPRLLIALVALNLGGYLAGAAGGWLMRLPGPMRRALTLEIGMQNAGLGATLAVALFGQECHEAIAPAVYTFGCMFTGTLLARAWARFASPAESAPQTEPSQPEA